MDYTLFEARPGISVLLLPDDPKFTIIAASHDFVRTAGLKREDVIGKGFFELSPEPSLPPDVTGVQDISNSFRQVIRHKEAHQLFCLGYVLPGGESASSEKHWNSTNVPVFNTEGDVQFIIHSSELITGHLRTAGGEDHLKGLQKAYELFMQAPAAICMVSGAEHVVDFANEHMLQLLGRTSEMVGKPISDSLTEARVQGLLAILDGVRTTGRLYNAPVFPAELNIGGKRELRYFDLVFQPYFQSPHDPVPASIFCMAYNITQQVLSQKKLEESSQELQLAIDLAELGSFRVDLLNDRATYSERVVEWFGFTGQGLRMDAILNHVHPEDRSLVVRALEATYISEANSLHNVSYRVVHPAGGGVRHLRSFGKTFFNAHGAACLMLGIIQDITEQIQEKQHLRDNEAELQKRVLERTTELEQLNEELRRSNQNLEEFAHAASHDLKEPIRKVLTFSDRLKQGLSGRMDEKERLLFERMEHATKRMGMLVDDLLNYSHVSERPLQMEEVDLARKISLVLVDLEVLMEQKGAQVTVDPMPKVRGYSRQLQQLFQNLIGNALKYSKAGTAPQIRITSRQVEGHRVETPVHIEPQQRAYYLVQVTDNGIGFEQEYAERIFGMFQRLHGKAEFEGTGVGLSIARKVAENHGGYIWAESEPGLGSTFSILLPVE